MTSGNETLRIGEVLSYDQSTGIGKVLDMRIVSGSLADGDATLAVVTSRYYRLNAITTSSGNYTYRYFYASNGERAARVPTVYSGSTPVSWQCDRAFSAPETWKPNDLLETVSDLDLHTVSGTDEVYDNDFVTDKPHGDMRFHPRPSVDERAIFGSLAPGEHCKFWLQQHILANVPAHSGVTGAAHFSWY